MSTQTTDMFVIRTIIIVAFQLTHTSVITGLRTDMLTILNDSTEMQYGVVLIKAAPPSSPISRPSFDNLVLKCVSVKF